jgi:hypothetical protein
LSTFDSKSITRLEPRIDQKTFAYIKSARGYGAHG